MQYHWHERSQIALLGSHKVCYHLKVFRRKPMIPKPILEVCCGGVNQSPKISAKRNKSKFLLFIRFYLLLKIQYVPLFVKCPNFFLNFPK